MDTPEETAQSHSRSSSSGSRRSRGDRRRRDRENLSEGRTWLVVIFILFRCDDAIVFFGTPEGHRYSLLGSIITNAIWTTALLVGIGYRKNWARNILIALLVLAIIGAMVVVPALFEETLEDNTVYLVLGLDTLIKLGVAWALISNSAIRRLAGRGYDD